MSSDKYDNSDEEYEYEYSDEDEDVIMNTSQDGTEDDDQKPSSSRKKRDSGGSNKRRSFGSENPNAAPMGGGNMFDFGGEFQK